MTELSWFCKECKRLNNDCKGNTNSIYTNCVLRKHWLDRGNKVRVIKNMKVGIIQEWDWLTRSYMVKFHNEKVLPFKQDELEEVVF